MKPKDDVALWFSSIANIDNCRVPQSLCLWFNLCLKAKVGLFYSILIWSHKVNPSTVPSAIVYFEEVTYLLTYARVHYSIKNTKKTHKRICLPIVLVVIFNTIFRMLEAKVKASDYMFKNIQLKDTLNRHKEKLLQRGEGSVQLAFSYFFSMKHFFYI